MSTALLTDITIFVLALLVGFEVISKVPATLHTPLMSGANSILGVRCGAKILGDQLLRVDGELRYFPDQSGPRSSVRRMCSDRCWTSMRSKCPGSSASPNHTMCGRSSENQPRRHRPSREPLHRP